MHAFAALLDTLDTPGSGAAGGDAVVQAEQGAELRRHFASVAPADGAWAVALLGGRAPKPPLSLSRLGQLAPALSGLDDWLFEACRRATGDTAEAIAHALPTALSGSSPTLAEVMTDGLPSLRGLGADEQVARLRSLLMRLDPAGRFVLLKLAAGGVRSPIRPQQLQHALAGLAGLPLARVALRLADWSAGAPVAAEQWQLLVAPAAIDVGRHAAALPLPFTPTRPLVGASGGPAAPVDLAGLGPCDDWLVELRQGGVRAQLVRRAGSCWIWSAEGELLCDPLPEVKAAAAPLADGCVLEGELLPWTEGSTRPAPVDGWLLRRQRTSTSRTALSAAPVVFVADDLLESDGLDRRGEPLARRRERLQGVLAAAPRLRLSTLREPPDWSAVVAWHDGLRAEGLQALVLRRRDAGAPDVDATAWAWAAGALTIDAVLLYVQPGAGGRSGSDLDCTLALWNRPPRDAADVQAVVDAIETRQPPEPDGLQLVPVARVAVHGADAERARLDREVRANTLQSFGPVRSLRPTLVLSLAFDGLQRSARRKSGVELRGARLLGLHDDLPLHRAGNLPALLEQAGKLPSLLEMAGNLPASMERAGGVRDQAPGSPDTDGSLRTS